MSHADTLVTAASLIAGFGSAVIAFRLQRELDIEEKNEQRPPHLREQHWFPDGACAAFALTYRA